MGVQSGTVHISDSDIASSPNSLLITCIEGSVMTDAPAFTLRFRGKKCLELFSLMRVLDFISAEGQKLPAEIYTGDGFNIHSIQLNVIGEIEYKTEVFEIRPNPFFESAIMTFELSDIATLSFEVFDTNGRLITNYKMGEFNRGKNAFGFSRGDFVFPHSGLYYLFFKLDYRDPSLSNEMFTKKIILQERR